MTEIRLTNGNTIVVTDTMMEIKDSLNINNSEYILVTFRHNEEPVYVNRNTISYFSEVITDKKK